VEALGAGCPAVMKRAGADGTEEAPAGSFLSVTTGNSFERHILRARRNEEHRHRLESTAVAFARVRFDAASLLREPEPVVATRLSAATRGATAGASHPGT
jgi:hypothetical protein